MAYQRGVFWGVVPYTPAAPFEAKLLWNFEEFETVAGLVREFKQRGIAGEIPFSVRGKVRPVLALSEPSTELRDVTALRLANISRRVHAGHLTADEARAVDAGEHPYLFPLRHAVVSKLTRTRETYAVIFDSPITLNESAITTESIGEISEEEFADLCALFVEALQLDLSALVEEEEEEEEKPPS